MSDKAKGAFIYADESGHSGKNIFDEKSPLYFQGAIVSSGDIESKVAPIIERYCQNHKLERLHGYELGEGEVNSLCLELLEALNGVHWQFHYTVIEKKYIAPIKFVDTVFDSFDNPAVHPFWYTVELFRHMLCIIIDEMMDGLDVEFWECYLQDDLEGLIKICSALLERSPGISDWKAREVVTAGLSYAIENPSILTLSAAKGRSEYKKQTPNMIAFSSLLIAIHRFCKKFNISVAQFVHDQSDEFKGTMREYHRLFFGLSFEEDKFGGIPKVKEVEYDLGMFEVKSSKQSYGLQVVDLFLWLIQRDISDKRLQKTKNKILKSSDDFVISRDMSLAIIYARKLQLMREEISPEMLEEAKDFNKKIEASQLARIKKANKS